MAELYQKIPANSSEAASIVTCLCKFVVQQCLEAVSSEETDKMIVGAFYCLTDWIMADQWIIRNPHCLAVLVNAVVVGLGMKKVSLQHFI